MSWVKLPDGQSMHYYDLGSRNAQVCVLVHGFAMPSFLWLPSVLRLTRKYRFIIPSLRGFGASEKLHFSDPDVLSQYADDLAVLIERLHLDDVALAGLSMGAGTSMQYLRRHGSSRVRAYLNIDQGWVIQNSAEWPWGLMGENQQERFDFMLALHRDMDAVGRDQAFYQLPRPLRDRLWTALAAFCGDGFAGKQLGRMTSLLKHEVLSRRVIPMGNYGAYMDILAAYAQQGYDWRDVVSQLDIPLTAFVAMRSAMYPAAGQLKVQELNPAANVVRFDKGGHALPMEVPGKFRKAFGAWLTEVWQETETVTDDVTTAPLRTQQPSATQVKVKQTKAA